MALVRTKLHETEKYSSNKLSKLKSKFNYQNV